MGRKRMLAFMEKRSGQVISSTSGSLTLVLSVVYATQQSCSPGWGLFLHMTNPQGDSDHIGDR
jgi:hypothetical protein